MSTHTPIIETTETFLDVASRHIACALRFYDGREDITSDVYHRENHTICDRMANAWIDCKLDDINSYGRALCYGALGVPYSPGHFDNITEIHYSFESDKLSMIDYWVGIAKYTKRSLDGLI